MVNEQILLIATADEAVCSSFYWTLAYASKQKAAGLMA